MESRDGQLMSEDNTTTGEEPANSLPATGPGQRGLTILLSVIFVIVFLLFTVGLFKHISYPLMWADESMTAVGGQRVLEFGYPKVHDGRNVFYDLRHDDLTLGIDKKTDAYIGGAGWGHYYFVAPFVALSQSISDLYLKTAMLRVPFALAGLAGMLLLLWTGIRPLETRLNRLSVAVLFIVLELPSVTLMLHLREVRYYSLQLLLSTIAICVFAAFHLYSSIRFRTYAVTMVCMVPFLFITFSPASVALCAAVCLYLGGEWVISYMRSGSEVLSQTRSGISIQLKSLYPVIASSALVAPLAWFFQTLHISRKLQEFYSYSLSTYLENISILLGYFARYDIIVFAVAAKLLLLLFRRNLRGESALHPVLKLSLFLSVYFIVYALIIGKIPNRLFTRYFITLQPILVLTFALDLLILARLSLGMETRRRMAGAAAVVLLLSGSIGWAIFQNRQPIRGHLFEMSNQYKGELDFIIPFIRERYERPDRLVIATNYEETSYIYYLGSKVIVGFLNPDLQQNLQQALMEQPDCIIIRRSWSHLSYVRILEELLKLGDYDKTGFTVRDYLFNNIPEVWHWTPEWGWINLHIFQTLYDYNPATQATLYFRRSDSLQNGLHRPDTAQ
jgi:hypothetical protein